MSALGRGSWGKGGGWGRGRGGGNHANPSMYENINKIISLNFKKIRKIIFINIKHRSVINRYKTFYSSYSKLFVPKSSSIVSKVIEIPIWTLMSTQTV